MRNGSCCTTSKQKVFGANDIMNNLKAIGRVFFAIPITVFGVQYLSYGRFARGLPPVPPWAPGGAAAAYLTGALLVVAGVCILANVQVRLSAAVLGTFCFLCVVALHTMRLIRVINQGDERTGALEALALATSGWVLAGSSAAGVGVFQGWQSFTGALGKIGIYLFAFSMVIFGVQHFMYAPYIATLIPAWMPTHLFLTYFTGSAFIAAAMAIATRIQARLGASSLGLMFLLWVVLLHAPRVFAHIHNKEELTSLFVALAMSGGSFILAGAVSKSR
jgi:uncharacterized membrane protein